MKYVSIDIETTGLDPRSNDIIEFGAIIDDLSNRLPFDQLPRFHAYLVKDSYTGSPFALSMHQTIFERIAKETPGYTYLSASLFDYNAYEWDKEERTEAVTNRPSLGSVFQEFLISNGFELKEGKVTINAAGKNFSTFDLPFLEQRSDFSSFIKVRHRVLDPTILYYQENDEKLPDMKTCLSRAGIATEVQHNAIGDALDVIKLLRFKLNKEREYSPSRLFISIP